MLPICQFVSIVGSVSDTRVDSSVDQGKLDNDITRGPGIKVDADIFFIPIFPKRKTSPATRS